MTTSVRYCVGLKTCKARVKTAVVDDLVRRMLAGYGTAEFFEWYQAVTVGKVVFDVDGKVGDTTARELLDRAMRAVETFFGFMPDRVLVSASHGGAKLSYRIYVPGFRMRIADQKARLLRLGLDGRSGGPFDAAIYGANQKLRLTGSVKTAEDARLLRLIDPVDMSPVEPTRGLLADTIVQVVDDEWPLLVEGEVGTSGLQSSGHRRDADEAADEAAGSTDMQVQRAPKRHRGRPRKEESIPADARAVLVRMGFTEPRFVAASAEGFAFDAANRGSCPNCARAHESNNWYCIPKPDEYVVANYSEHCVIKRYPRVVTVEAITPAHADFDDSLALLRLDEGAEGRLRAANLHYHEKVIKVACYRSECVACDSHHDCTTYTTMQLLPRHCWSVRNDDNSCPGRIFHHSAQLANMLKRLFVAPNDEALVGLFLEGHRGGLHVDRESETTYFWDSAPAGGGRWRQVSNTEFDSHLSGWLNALLYGVAMLPEFKDERKSLEKALAKAQTGNIRNLRHLVQGRLSLLGVQTGGTRMDADPYLLGAGTSVIELRAPDADTGGFTTVIRHARPEDLVTKSVGYEITPDFGDTAPVDAVFAQIYPVEEERRFFQLFGGYCLLGKAPAKGFLCLTDRRRGDNGKSTAVRLLRTALGDDYVIDNKQNLLYEARFASGVNAHDSGMMAFEGKRLALMEELSATRALDTSFLKQITGGETCISVRAANSATTRAMPWSAKLITVFNEGCAPRFKVEDEAFTKRMIVMPHRSLFCKDRATWDAHRDEPDTHRADGAKIDALQPSQILAWFLCGLERYWAGGQVEFEVPAACREWAGELVQEQDGVRTWLEEHLQLGADSDFVTKKDLETAIRAANLSFRPTHLRTKLQQLFGSAGVHCKVDHRAGGQKYTSAWMNLKWV